MAKRTNKFKKKDGDPVTEQKNNLGANSIKTEEELATIEKENQKNQEENASEQDNKDDQQASSEVDKAETPPTTESEETKKKEEEQPTSETEEGRSKIVKKPDPIKKEKGSFGKMIGKSIAYLILITAGLWLMLSSVIWLAGWAGATGPQTPRSYNMSPSKTLFGAMDFEETTNQRRELMPLTDSSRLFSDNREIELVEIVNNAIFLTDGEPMVYHKVPHLDSCIKHYNGEEKWCVQGEPHRRGTVAEWDVQIHWFSLVEQAGDFVITMTDLNNHVTYKIACSEAQIKNGRDDFHMLETMVLDNSGEVSHWARRGHSDEEFIKHDKLNVFEVLHDLVELKLALMEGSAILKSRKAQELKT